MAVVLEHASRPPDLSPEDLIVWERLSEELSMLQQEKRLMRQVVTAEILRIVTETHELAVQLSTLEDELSIYNDDIANLKTRKTEFSTTVENNSRLHRQMAQALEANAAARRLAQDSELRLARLGSSSSSDLSSASDLFSSTSSDSIALTPSSSTSSGLSDASTSSASSDIPPSSQSLAISASSTWTHPSTPNSPAPSNVVSGSARSVGTKVSPRLSPRYREPPQTDFRRLRSKTEDLLCEAGGHLDADNYVRRQAEEFERIIQDIRTSLNPVRKPS